jgi:CHAT domain-containing protein
MGCVDSSTRTLIVAGPGNDRGAAEVAAIAAARPGAAVLIGPDATAAATLAAMSDADLVHIAAHGHHQPDNALFSELWLSSGPLMGYELRQLAAPPAMIVLSSCEVGLHDVRPGDEMLGMATAMLGAGSSTVIASVCRVADESAVTVMVRYHEALLEGHQPAAALAAAGEPGLDTGFICFGAG